MFSYPGGVKEHVADRITNELGHRPVALDGQEVDGLAHVLELRLAAGPIADSRDIAGGPSRRGGRHHLTGFRNARQPSSDVDRGSEPVVAALHRRPVMEADPNGQMLVPAG